MTKTKDQKPKTKDEPKAHDDVVALLLAAGQSQRMGAFKPLLPFGDSTVIHTCLANLHSAGVATVIVVVGHRAAEVQASLSDVPYVRFAINPAPESEMSASIAYGIEMVPASAKAILIALTDQPAVPPDITQSILGAWREGAKLVIPESNKKGGHPVLIDASFRDQLLQLDPHRGLKGFFDDHREIVRRLLVDSPYIARDIDTWDDYRALHEEVFGTLPNTMDR